MSSPSLIANPVWADAIERVIALSNAESQRNAELQARVNDLELEVMRYRALHYTTVETHNSQLSAMTRQLSRLEVLTPNNPTQLVLCVIDGDEFVFQSSQLRRGQLGGNTSSRELSYAIAEALRPEGISAIPKLSFWAVIYMNKARLIDRLASEGLCTAEQFEDFLLGFSETSGSFIVVDVPGSSQAIQSKISKYLRTYAPFGETLKIFLAARHISQYQPTFANLEIEGCLDKLVLVRDGGYETGGTPTFDIKKTVFNNVFGELSHHACTPTPPGSLYNIGLMSPESPTRVPQMKVIDPSLPLHKQSPPPCNEHYLMICSKGPMNCKYSHEYVLTQEQLATLAANAKKAPCNWLKNGVDCPYGDKCCWGHTCPNGSRCFHLSKGKCWFKGPTMHPPMSPPATPVLSSV